MSSAMYQEMILDYYRNPRNHGKVQNPDFVVSDANPLCGDVIEMSARINDGVITEVKFSGKGCAISQAAASMLTEHVQNKPVESVKNLAKKDVLELLSIPISPIRLKCALLGLKVLKIGVYQYLGEQLSREEKEEL